MLAVPDSKDIYSEKDVKDLGKIMADTHTWFHTTWKKQNETSPEKNPVLLTKDIYSYQGKLDREVAYLLNKAKYHVPKPKPKPAASNTTANATAGDDKKAEKPGDKTNQKSDDKKSDDKKSEDKKSEDKKSEDKKSTEKPEPTKETEKEAKTE